MDNRNYWERSVLGDECITYPKIFEDVIADNFASLDSPYCLVPVGLTLIRVLDRTQGLEAECAG